MLLRQKHMSLVEQQSQKRNKVLNCWTVSDSKMIILIPVSGGWLLNLTQVLFPQMFCWRPNAFLVKTIQLKWNSRHTCPYQKDTFYSKMHYFIVNTYTSIKWQQETYKTWHNLTYVSNLNSFIYLPISGLF